MDKEREKTDLEMAEELMADVKSKGNKALYLVGCHTDRNTMELLNATIDISQALSERVKEQDEQYEKLMKEVKQLKGICGDMVKHQKAIEAYLEKLTTETDAEEEPVQKVTSNLHNDAISTVNVIGMQARDEWLNDTDNEQTRQTVLVWDYILYALYMMEARNDDRD